MAKGSAPGCGGEKQPSFPPFPEDHYGRGAFKERFLCSLPPLRSSSCLQCWRLGRQRGVAIHKMICGFLSLPRKSSAVSAYSAVDFFFILGGRRDLNNFLCNGKISRRFMSQWSGHKFGGEAYIIPVEIAWLFTSAA
jgi:hypothetical protein